MTADNGGPRPGTALLEIQDVTVDYSSGWRRPPVRAIDQVSLHVGVCETLGLVGESGSGKSTLGKAILGLTRTSQGRVTLDSEDVTDAGQRTRRRLSRHLQVVFQDPYSSLNPTRTVGQSLAEMLRADHTTSRADVRARVREMLERVGLPPGAAGRYPATFSGGQRQRIAIARALMPHPRLVICDEAVSALDVSVQAQILNLFRDLQVELDLSYLFISHDLAVVRHVSHRIAVLYRGRLMEVGEAGAVYDRPAHPYTRALLEAAPVPDPVEQERRRRARTPAAAADRADPAVTGCPFAQRCPHAIGVCRSVRPELTPTPGGSLVACHRWRELAP